MKREDETIIAIEAKSIPILTKSVGAFVISVQIEKELAMFHGGFGSIGESFNVTVGMM